MPTLDPVTGLPVTSSSTGDATQKIQLGSFVVQHEVNYPKLTQLGLVLIAAALGASIIKIIFAVLLKAKD